MSISLILLICILGGLLLLLSLIEVAASRLSRVSVRVLAERVPLRRLPTLERMGRDKLQFLLPLQFANQLLMVSIAILITVFLLSQQVGYPELLALLSMAVLIGLLRQILPRLLTGKNPEQVVLRSLPFLGLVYGGLFALSFPIIVLLRLAHRIGPGSGPPEEEEEEASEAEIQAYLEVGEEDGIFEQDETLLLQSALEFGTTLVREIMTPRAEVVAIDQNSTQSDLRDLISSSKHSRIPVYRDSPENIVGVAFVRNLVAQINGDWADQPITPLIKKPWFVPETKKVSDLLKEMQLKSEPMAFVVSEYGSVLGLVTIEDMIEEIVGEIYDEDETQEVDILEEEGGSLVVQGWCEIADLEESLGVDLGEVDATTVSGWVVDKVGKVPAAGERLVVEPVEVEVLEANRKRIGSMRIRLQSRVPAQPGSGEAVEA